MSFGCRSLSVPNSAPRRLPDATAPHRQREGNGYAEQGRGRCAARRHLLPPVGGGRGQGRPRAGQPQHPEPEVHAGTVRGRARLADIQYLQRRRLYGQRQGTPPVQPFAGGCAQGLLRHRAVQKPEPLHPRDGAGGKIHPRPVRGMERALCGLCRQRRHRKSWQQKGQADQRAGERMVSGGYVPEYPHRAGRKAAAGGVRGQLCLLRIPEGPEGQTPPACGRAGGGGGAAHLCAVPFRLGRFTHCGTAQPGTGAESQRIQKAEQPGFQPGPLHRAGRALERFHRAGHPEKAGVHRNHWRENAAARCAAESCKANTAVRENTCGAAPTLWPRSAARV